jgi:hypothetical protein
MIHTLTVNMFKLYKSKRVSKVNQSMILKLWMFNKNAINITIKSHLRLNKYNYETL